MQHVERVGLDPCGTYHQRRLPAHVHLAYESDHIQASQIFSAVAEEYRVRCGLGDADGGEARRARERVGETRHDHL